MGDEPRKKAETRLEQIRVIYDRHGTLFHVAWIAVAVVVIVAGLAMTVLPGPAMAVLPLGVAMLAVVFSWARRLLLFGVDEGANAARAWKHAGPWLKVLTGVTLAAAAVGLAALLVS